MPEDTDLERIVDQLDRYHVRATYGAVANLLGRPATFLMSNLERQPRYSWIVNGDTLLPSGYEASQRHAHLEENKMVLRTERRLRDWLQGKTADPSM